MYYNIICIINNYEFGTELAVYHSLVVNQNAHIWLSTSIEYLIPKQ